MLEDKMLAPLITVAHIVQHFQNEPQDKILAHSAPEAHIAAPKTNDSESATAGKGA